MKDTVRVLIADDHPLFREGMRGRLDRVADVAVVGEAASGDEAVELAHKLEPHVDPHGHQDAGPEWHRGHPRDPAGKPAIRRVDAHHVRGR